MNDVLDRGAVGWYVMNLNDEVHQDDADPVAPTVPAFSVHPGDNQSKPAAVVSINSVAQADYLLHWTRVRFGPWPDQSELGYLDDLLLGSPCADHSALATLSRIVATRRIIASSLWVRGKQSVVSFTGRQLGELGAMRVYRPHLGRWDFEPYGIAIRKERLLALNTRPVVYGDESTWQQLAAAKRPYFQMSGTAKLPRQSPIDWTVEDEWRHIGDVDLSTFTKEEALVFVPTIEEARHMARLSKWPVVVVG